jgi:hypothetical protein
MWAPTRRASSTRSYSTNTKLRKQDGEPSERFVGPMHGHGERTIHRIGEEVGAGGMETQAGIWKAAQLRLHGDPTSTTAGRARWKTTSSGWPRCAARTPRRTLPTSRMLD